MNFKKEKIPRIVVTIVATIVIIFGTIAVVAYSRGYRFNNSLGLVVKTGVLNIESNPIRTDVFLDGKSKGKTPKTISSIAEGQHQVEVTRDGYHSWNKSVEIKYEKSTPIYPHLFLIKPDVEEVFSIEDEVVDVFHLQKTNYIFVLTRIPITSQSDLASVDNENDFLYRVWRYDTNPIFWSAQNNPILVLEKELVDLDEFNLLLSPTAEYALATIKYLPLSENAEGTIENYLLNTDLNNNPEVINLTKYLQTYKLYWAEDEEHFIAVSDEQILSIDISSGEESLLLQSETQIDRPPSQGDEQNTDTEETSEFIWSTDEDSNFYYIEHIDPDENTPGYMQVQILPIGSQSNTSFIDKIYYSNDDKYLISQDELEEHDGLFVFTNSPAASQFAGEIKDLKLLETVNMMFIETEYASYLYDIKTDKYILVSSIPTQLVNISPDEEKLLLRAEDSVQLFTFDKEDADHVTKLGSLTIIDKNPARLKWHGASRVILYSENDRFKSIDIERENNFDIADLSENLFALEDSGDNIFTIKEEEGSMKILKVKIN